MEERANDLPERCVPRGVAHSYACEGELGREGSGRSLPSGLGYEKSHASRGNCCVVRGCALFDGPPPTNNRNAEMQVACSQATASAEVVTAKVREPNFVPDGRHVVPDK